MMKDGPKTKESISARPVGHGSFVSSAFCNHTSSLFLAVCLILLALCGCGLTASIAHNIILPEQRTIAVRDPAQLAPAELPPIPPPRTVTDRQPGTPDWPLSLDDAIRISLEQARIIRTLSGVTAQASGQTIYDAAIVNTTIDQEQARFDPVLADQNTWQRIETPQPIPDPSNPLRTIIDGTATDTYLSQLSLTKTNVLGGQESLTWTENPTRFTNLGPFITPFPLNPQNMSAVQLKYTQPLLQGAGFAVNTAPIVIARLDTERSYFQLKDSVQELVRGTIEAYWNLVQARTEVWARNIQVEQSDEAYKRSAARMKAGLADLRDVAQARVTYNQFRANLIAAQANVLAREGALRNLLGLPPNDKRQIIPVSVPAQLRYRRDWDALLRLAQERRPDIVELKLILEADQVRLVQAQNKALPQLDALALYSWNGLSGVMPNGDRLSTQPNQYGNWTVGINFSVPLGLRQGRALVRQAELIIARDYANLDQGLHLAAHSLANSVRDIDNAYEQYLAYKETRLAARDNLLVQLAEYFSGRGIYLSVLQALNDWGNSVTSEAQSLLAYNIALATLERQTGTIMETHGLVFWEEHIRAAGPLCIFGKSYPSANQPTGNPQRYPPTGEASENAFDLRKPELPKSESKEPTVLPPPRRLPDSP
jgi:outer membrane protein TolC